MGSFVEDTVKMLRRFYDWLEPGGYVFISFYNENSVLLRLTPNWRDTSLSAHIDPENQSLTVELTPKIKFNIFCKPFNEVTKSEINGLFHIDKILTYSTLMALLPNNLLQDRLAHKLFKYIDDSLAANEKYQLGHYVIVIAHKPDKSEASTPRYEKIIKILKENNAKYEIIEHEPVLSIDDVKKRIGDFGNCVIKTIIFKVRIKKFTIFVCVTLSAEKRVNKEVIAEALNKSDLVKSILAKKGENKNIIFTKSKIKFAPEKDVLKLGFPIGGIAPFGNKENIGENTEVINIIDENVFSSNCKWFYTGVGDNRKTLKIERDSFLRIVKDYLKVKL